VKVFGRKSWFAAVGVPLVGLLLVVGSRFPSHRQPKVFTIVWTDNTAFYTSISVRFSERRWGGASYEATMFHKTDILSRDQGGLSKNAFNALLVFDKVGHQALHDGSRLEIPGRTGCKGMSAPPNGLEAILFPIRANLIRNAGFK